MIPLSVLREYMPKLKDEDLKELGPVEYDQSKVPEVSKKHAENVRRKAYLPDMTESFARGVEYAGLMSSEAENKATNADLLSKDTQNRFKDQIEGTTNSDEVIDARRPFGSETIFKTVGERLDDSDSTIKKLNADLVDANRNLTSTILTLKTEFVSLLDFGAIADANYFNSITREWYKNGKYENNMGVIHNDNYYWNPDWFGNYYQNATFSTISTDVALAFNEALDYISRTDTTLKLFVPSGRYMIDSQILHDLSNFEIYGEGEGSVLVPGPNLTGAMFRSDHSTRKNGTLKNVKFRNFTMDGMRNPDLYGMLFSGFDRGSSMVDMTVKGFGKAQVALKGSWGFTIEKSKFNGYYITDGNSERDYFGTGVVMGRNELPIVSPHSTVNIPNLRGNTFQWLEEGLDYYYGAGANVDGNNFENVDKFWARITAVEGISMRGNYFEDLRQSIFGVILGGNAPSYFTDAIDFTGNSFMERKDGHNDIQINNLRNSVVKSNRHFGENGTQPGNDVAFGTNSTYAFGNEIHFRSSENTGAGNIDNRKNWLISKSATAMSRVGGW